MTMVSTTLTSDTVVIICTFSTEISAAATRLSSICDSLLSSTRQIAFLWGSELSWNYPFLSVLLADAACVLRRSSHSHIYWTFTRDPTYWHWLTAKLATFKVFLHRKKREWRIGWRSPLILSHYSSFLCVMFVFPPLVDNYFASVNKPRAAARVYLFFAEAVECVYY